MFRNAQTYVTHLIALMVMLILSGGISLIISDGTRLATAANEQNVAGQSPVANPAVTPECVPNSVVILSANVLNTNQFLGVDGIAANDVWAVGNYSTANITSPRPLIEHWNGTSWTQIAFSTPLTQSLSLAAVVAVASNNVWAVGYSGTQPGYNTQPVTLHWDGTRWNNVPAPGAGGSNEKLNGVAAVSANDIWAVGSSANLGVSQTMIMHWDGARWNLVSSPSRGSLNSVSAVSTNDVWAVGQHGQTPSYGVLIEHWDGTQWTVAFNPDNSDNLLAVEAIAANDVWAAGSGNSVLRWNGTEWKTVSIPVPCTLYSLDARSANDVWAVGQTRGAPIQQIVVLRWDGAQWSQVPSPNVQSNVSEFYGVKAFAGGDIWALGASGNSEGYNIAVQQTLAARRIGTAWTITPSANPGYMNNFLRRISAVSANDIWAVGSYGEIYNPRTLTEHWDGARWNVISSSSLGYNDLYDVAAVSANDVWTVGNFNDGVLGKEQPTTQFKVIGHWNGAQWSSVSSPSPGADANRLFGVAAAATNDVWVVGDYGNFQATQPLIERWNGTQWSVVPSPNINRPGLNLLNHIAVVSANDVWAVGSSGGYSNAPQTLIEHWNGSVWSVVISPNTGGGSSLYSVAAISTNDVWAVGSFCAVSCGVSPYQTLTERWDGTQWSIAPSPSHGTLSNALFGVSAASANDVWAVGYFGPNGHGQQTLMLHWDGTQWSYAPSQNPGALDSLLLGVAAVREGDVWAVGHTFSADVSPYQTLVEHVSRFSDVAPTDYFSAAVNYLVSHGAISGYDDCTFRAWTNMTRAQLAKIIVLAKGWNISARGGPHFEDVPTNNPFYGFIETAFNHGVIGGYANNTFRPYNDVTRAQLCKIIVIAQGWPTDTHGGPHFSDVPPAHPFYDFVETAYNRGIISGYSDGAFRQGNSATRGQIAKIVYQALTAP